MELQMWKEILTPYDLAVEELKVKFNHIVKEYQQMNGYSPIEQVLGRVKSISSIIDKAQKKVSTWIKSKPSLKILPESA